MTKTLIPHSRPAIGDDEVLAVTKTLRSGRLSEGSEGNALEADLSDMLGRSEVAVVSSGTSALYLALIALGVTRGQKVIIPSYTCNSLYAAVTLAGATPICADVGAGGVCITRDTVEPLLDDTVTAVIAPHTCGYLVDIDDLRALGVPVVEDCAQAVGAVYPDGTPLGTKGDVTVLSFYATKLVPAGEGGACVARDAGLIDTVRELRSCDKQALVDRAFNFKLSDIHAALARSKIQGLSAAIKERQRVAEWYDRAFDGRSFRLKTSQVQAVCYRYLVETDGAVDAFVDAARAAGIVCKSPIWRPLHHSLGGHCPETERLETKLASVPIYPGLSNGEINRICSLAG